MEHKDKIKAIQFIRPNAVYTLNNDVLTWLDENQTEPTEAEIKAGWVAYQKADAIETKTKAKTRAELLDRIGITEDEAKLLLS